jgi:hypothetical protein
MIKEDLFTQQVLKRQGKTAALVRMAFIVEQAGGKRPMALEE